MKGSPRSRRHTYLVKFLIRRKACFFHHPPHLGSGFIQTSGLQTVAQITHLVCGTVAGKAFHSIAQPTLFTVNILKNCTWQPLCLPVSLAGSVLQDNSVYASIFSIPQYATAWISRSSLKSGGCRLHCCKWMGAPDLSHRLQFGGTDPSLAFYFQIYFTLKLFRPNVWGRKQPLF